MCTVVQNGRLSDSGEAGLAAGGWMGCPNYSAWTGSVELCLRWAVQLFVLLAVSAGMSELVSVLKRGREAVQTFL